MLAWLMTPGDKFITIVKGSSQESRRPNVCSTFAVTFCGLSLYPQPYTVCLITGDLSPLLRLPELNRDREDVFGSWGNHCSLPPIENGKNVSIREKCRIYGIEWGTTCVMCKMQPFGEIRILKNEHVNFMWWWEKIHHHQRYKGKILTKRVRKHSKSIE